MFSKRVKHYHQWLRTAIPFKAKLGQISSDSVRVQGPTKRPSLGHLYPVSPVKERYRKGGKCKISRVLQSPVLSTQASPKVEASHRPKQAQYFSTHRKVQNGNSRVHQDLLIPGEWVASIDLSDAYLHIPIHPNSRKYLRFCYKAQVFQFTSLPFGLATAPQVFTMIVKEVKLMALSRGLRIHQYLDDWLIRSQSWEEAQVDTQAVVDLTQSLGWIINQEKSELKPTRVFSFVGYEYHLDSALVKPTQERWLKLQDLILRLKSKRVLTARRLMSNWVASLNGENGPRGTPSHEALSVSSQGALEISSVAGQPPSLDRSHCSPPRLVAKSLKRDERCRPSSQRPQYPTLYRRLKRRLGRSLRPKFYKGSVVRSGKKATHK